MRFTRKVKTGLVAAVVLAALLAISANRASPASESTAAGAHRGLAPDIIVIAPGAMTYRAAGDFSRAGLPANAPVATVRIDRGLAIMKRQVSAVEYQSCADAGACLPLAGSLTAPDRPVVGVSWRDADAYATWLSGATGARFRLPTDVEWAFAAGSRFRDDALPDSDATNPARRWLARYAAQSEQTRPIEPEPQPIGTFGANEHGVLDLAGNVWEWTDSCFVRAAIEASGDVRATLVNCGVRVVEGAHRVYVSDFIRDARAGGCAVGPPPSNLGFRLVRDYD